MNLTMFYAAISLILIKTVFSSKSCIQTTDGSGSGTSCTNSKELYCSRPFFTDYTGAAEGVPYQCGQCAADTEGSTCYQCKPLDSVFNCNAPPVLGTPFKCWNYTEVAGKWEKEQVTCTPLQGKALGCNSPAITRTPDSTYVSKSGCGPCPETTLGCRTCTDKELCNAAPRDMSRVTCVISSVILSAVYLLVY